MDILQSTYNIFSSISFVGVLFGIITAVFFLGFIGTPLWIWTVFSAAILWGFGAPLWAWIVFGILAFVFNIKPLRRLLATLPTMRMMKAMKFLPKISETERTAIEAGTVWVDGEFFSGKPNFKRINNEAYPKLTDEEQAFLDGPVEEVCRMVSDWEVTQQKDFTPEAWEYLKKEKFFGMIIPKEYGGLEFSAFAHSEVIAKIASRSLPLTITVMVPNSLGPAELLNHYGTQEQKDYYLPRLARGEEMPCFALTEPTAGSDAGAIESNGVVFKDEEGKLYIRLNWKKRYITLAAISTVLGLAFKLKDPENLLGNGKNLGITCALIPSDAPGVVLGRRHDPLGVPFYNCPTEGHDVVVPLDAIIGGVEGIGKGWKMLMESLAAGRGISLPAQSTGGAKFVTRVVGNYTAIRKQFGLSIGRFEGIEEPLARIAGFTYLLEATRKYTCGALDSGAKPAVITAIAKYNSTELARKIINDAMDIQGGAGISRGPRNLLANGYIASPISITVEGANILTRTLMIFGQGVIRSHPYAYKEIEALDNNDINKFDDALWSHAGHIARNAFRSILLSITRGYMAGSPSGGPAAKYYRKLSWASATFALLSDIAMLTLGGNLKRKEKLTGRFADIFSWLYLASATLHRFETEGRRKEDIPLLNWALQYALSQIQHAFDGLFENMRIPLLSFLFRGPVALWSRMNPIGKMPSDKLGGKIARCIQLPGVQRDTLTEGIFIPKDQNDGLRRLELAFDLVSKSETVMKKVKKAVYSGKLAKDTPQRLIEKALKLEIINQEEAALLQEAESARNDAIQVDDFSQEEYLHSMDISLKSELLEHTISVETPADAVEEVA